MKRITGMTLSFLLCITFFVANVYADEMIITPSTPSTGTESEKETIPSLPPLPENVAKLFEEVAVELDMTCSSMAILDGLPYTKLVGRTKTGTVFTATVITVMQMGDNCAFAPPSQENVLGVIWLLPDATKSEMWLNKPLIDEIIEKLKGVVPSDLDGPPQKIKI